MKRWQRIGGWTPEADYKPKLDKDGNPRPFVGAEEFVRNIRQVNKIEENERLHREIKEIKNTVGEFKKFTDKSHAAEVAKLKQELQEKRSAAISDMDEVLVDELDKQIKEADAEGSDTEGATVSDNDIADDQAALGTWQEKNTWYEDDAQLAGYADRYCQNERAKHPDKPFAEILVTVDEKMQKHFPKTESKARQTMNAPAVETGASNASGTGAQANQRSCRFAAISQANV